MTEVHQLWQENIEKGNIITPYENKTYIVIEKKHKLVKESNAEVSPKQNSMLLE